MKELIKIILNNGSKIIQFILQINMDKFEDGISLLKQYYHVDTILRAQDYLWLCNEIKTVEYEEIRG